MDWVGCLGFLGFGGEPRCERAKKRRRAARGFLCDRHARADDRSSLRSWPCWQ